mmetsp:Transcript_120837/g.240744  ORF Transcript_120837/g.240744 Transcript_120837/m.240744 type:complete len:94 (+) Transcript_120837:38-319(+)
MCGDGCCNALCACVCAYVVPPVGIFWRFGCGMEFLICFILTLLGYVPGIIYAVVMIGCASPGAEGREAWKSEGKSVVCSPVAVTPEGYDVLPE